MAQVSKKALSFGWHRPLKIATHFLLVTFHWERWPIKVKSSQDSRLRFSLDWWRRGHNVAGTTKNLGQDRFSCPWNLSLMWIVMGVEKTPVICCPPARDLFMRTEPSPYFYCRTVAALPPLGCRQAPTGNPQIQTELNKTTKRYILSGFIPLNATQQVRSHHQNSSKSRFLNIVVCLSCSCSMVSLMA